jgi:LmbE family N-acetylglucosaminyl deacetylase
MLPLSLGAGAAAPLRILCLGAHSDDIEIGCGGTLLRLLEERPGSAVDWVVLSSTPERQSEAEASAAAFLGHATTKNVIVKRFRESYFPYVAAEIKDAFEALRKSIPVPDLIFSHYRGDVHQDHRLVAELTWNTFRNHLVFEYEIPKYEGDLGAPSLFVPLRRATAERKVELLLQHFASQAHRPWFRADTFHGLMSIRGVECNAAEGRAEAFHVRKAIV